MNSQSLVTSTATPKFIVRWGGNYAVRFFNRGYELVGDIEATTFGSPEEAGDSAIKAQMRINQFTIERFEPGRAFFEANKMKGKTV